MIQFHYGGGGALVCDEPIEGITQDLLNVSEANGEESVRFYGGRYFVAESMSKSAAKRMAELLGGVLEDDR